MLKLKKLSAIVAAALAAGVLVGGGVVSVYALKSLPQLDGAAPLAGLSAPVTVRRDASDVTHIFAQQPLDAFRALGMVHAQERAWQLAFNRRVMHGTLAEVFGPATLPVDKLMRTLGIVTAAQAQWDKLPAHAQAVLQAYADGINAHLAQTEQAPTPEFKLLGLAPKDAAAKGEFWTPVDSLGWALMMALDLGGNWGNEFARLSAARTLDTAAVWQLFPAYAGEAPASGTDFAQLYRSLGVYATAKDNTKTGAASAHQQSDKAHFDAKNQPVELAQVLQWADGLGGYVEGKGSNNWVLSGKATASGKPLLANDPHLGLTAPAIWYFARLHAPAGTGDQAEQGALDVVGATLPGLPFVVLGRNDRVAWGFTNTGPDVQDLYVEAINPNNPQQYRVPAPVGAASDQTAWAEFDSRVETIRVKGQPDVQHTVRRTRHGPVLSDAQASHAEVLDTSRYVLALRWTALEADNQTLLAGLKGVRARSTEDLLQTAYLHYHSPMQNVVAADVDGRVAYKAAGRVPVRGPAHDLRGVAPALGWESRYDWTGWIPYAETPEVRFGTASFDAAAPQHAASAAQRAASAQAQERGWLATANQRIHGTDYPHFLTQDWAQSYRQDRIEQLLSAQAQHTPESLAAIQGDVYSLASVKILHHLGVAVAASQHPLAPAVQAAVKSFDGTMAADRTAPLILVAWADELTRRLLGARLGEARLKAMYGKRQFRTTLETLLDTNDTAWCGAEGCAKPSQLALDAALNRLQAQYGREVQRWRWGDAHQAVSRHNPFSNVPVLNHWFEVRVPTGGDSFTVNVGQYQFDKPSEPYANRHAASLRAIYDLADLENSRFIYQTGQSGNVFSHRYGDMAREWRDVRYRPLQLQPQRWMHTLVVRASE